MYTNPRYTAIVRDGGARYGDRPIPAEPYPAARVLDDLAAAPDCQTPRILARFAALRAWLLGHGDAPMVVVKHARSAARAHLAEADNDWAEGHHLGAALRARRRDRALEHIAAAATAAEAAGHVHGARALREAVHRARWRESGYPPPHSS